jgi:ABC-type cobalamin/Fe3+-siderophores transport system ATPase subunit
MASFPYPDSPAELLTFISFGVSEGWVGVIGSNGAGKNTLLRLSCGLFALRLADSPALVVMDEPTNHMDLPSSVSKVR